MDASANTAGTELTCSNPDCGCRLRIEQPCPHGSTYTCACGHPFEAMGVRDIHAIADRVEAEGVVDQQAIALDQMTD